MATKHLTVAALAAWFAVAAAAQGPENAAQTVEVRLAAAALAEARGDLAAAMRELQAAQATAAGDERTVVQAAIAALAARRGDAQSAPFTELLHEQGFGQKAQDARQDPVRRLIADLDKGSTRDPAIEESSRRLASLGTLVVPPLLEELPKLGPFGRQNALRLLVVQDDPRVPTALRALIAAQQDPATIAAVADVLGDMPRASAVAIAKDLVGPDVAAPVRMRAFRTLIGHDTPDAELLPIARALAELPALREQLVEQAKTARSEWSDAVLRKVAATDDLPANMRARQELLRRTPDLTEAKALAALGEMPLEFAAAVAPALAYGRPTWVRVGAFALRSNPRAQHDEQGWFLKMEWWRGGDEALAVLLALPEETLQKGVVRNAIEQILAAGCRVPPELDAALARFAQNGRWATFVAALPEDGEDRALAVWEGKGPYERRELVQTVVRQGRPWHRLVIQQLEADGQGSAPVLLLLRDWRGAPADVAARLARLVAEWHARSPVEAAAGPSSPPGDWRQAVRVAVQRGFASPDVLRPMVDTHDALAWSILAERDPAAALAVAAQWDDLDPIAAGVVATIRAHGTAEHMALCVRALRQRYERGEWPDMQDWFRTVGSGSPFVIALARRPGSGSRAADDRFLSIAAESAKAASVRDLDALLALLPELHADVAHGVIEALKPQLHPDHGPKLVRTLTSVLDVALSPERVAKDGQLGRIEPRYLAWILLGLVTELATQEAVPQAQRILATADADADLVEHAARSLLQLARDGRGPLLQALLADARPQVVQQALMVEDLRDDPALRQKVTDAILRCGDRLASLDYTFQHMRPDDGLALAKQLVEHPLWPKFATGVCQSVLTALGDRKDPALAPTLARGARHPDEGVRRWTAEALGRTFARDAVPYLIELLKDDGDTVRAQATESLEQIAAYIDAKAKWEERLK